MDPGLLAVRGPVHLREVAEVDVAGREAVGVLADVHLHEASVKAVDDDLIGPVDGDLEIGGQRDSAGGELPRVDAGHAHLPAGDRKEHTSELQSRPYLVCRLLL